MLTPPRRRGIEILDDPATDPELMKRSMRDVERANSLFGGRRAALAELQPAFASMTGPALLLDVGTGRGDIPAAARQLAHSSGLSLRTVGLDLSHALIVSQNGANDMGLLGHALALPFRDSSVDVVIASQILHHFPEEAAMQMVRELSRVARHRVVISDLRRSRVAAAGLWTSSFLLGFHPVSRHDGVVSVMRGFTPGELGDIVESATGTRPVVNRRLGFRLTTSWMPNR